MRQQAEKPPHQTFCLQQTTYLWQESAFLRYKNELSAEPLGLPPLYTRDDNANNVIMIMMLYQQISNDNLLQSRWRDRHNSEHVTERMTVGDGEAVYLIYLLSGWESMLSLFA